MLHTDNDTRWMRRALTLAQKGWGCVQPNPMVGAVLLDARGQCVGEGYHGVYGGPHAEVMAVENAKHLAPNGVAGGTLYVTLEPCAHHGKTPPCAELVASLELARVVIAVQDPNPKVSGQGIARLRAAGIDVTIGVLADEATALNRAFLVAMAKQRPYITLKQAATLNGHSAPRAWYPGNALGSAGAWFTGPHAKAYAHQLRQSHQAILTTANTVLADNPQLTVRLEHPPNHARTPVRVVLDRQAKLWDAAKQAPQVGVRVFETAAEDTWWLVSASALASRPALLDWHQPGLTIVRLSDHAPDHDTHEASWRTAMQTLFARGITSILVECGGTLAHALRTTHAVDEWHWITAPHWSASPQGVSALALPAPPLTTPDTWPTPVWAGFGTIETHALPDALVWIAMR